IHHSRAAERLGQENRIGMAALDVGNEPAPEVERLRMRVVDAENLDTVVDPEQDDVAQLGPQRAPLGSAKVDRVDVLIFLRRILGELHAAVGPAREPERMLAHVWMVGRALERDVESDLEAEPLGFAAEAHEVLERAELLVDALVPAVESTDRPWRAGIVGTGLERVVAAFAITGADRMDWRQVHDVEAHRRDIGQAASRGRERAMARKLLRGGAREELVPRAEASERPLDDGFERGGVDGLERTIPSRRHELAQRFGQS